MPRAVPYRDGRVETGIFKEPVRDTIRVVRHNLTGNGQADLSVHGGPDKAVYAYPSEHYGYWKETLGRDDLEPGTFGENLTTEGLIESEVRIGDRFRIGSTLLEVSQPRQPCFKLAMKLDRGEIVTEFRESKRSGFYLRVIEEGELKAGDPIEPVLEADHDVRVSDVNELHLHPDRTDLLERVLNVRELSESQRRHFDKQRRKSLA